MSEKQAKLLRVIERILFKGLIGGSIIGGLLLGWVARQVDSGKELTLLAGYRPSTPTRLYDRNGRVFAELFRHKQELLRFQDIPKPVVNAFLSIEDDQFYQHFGLDFFGILRAAGKNIIAGHITQGGSTLTQQVAKQIYLNAEGKRDRTVFQKVREAVLALQMEESLSKEEILEVYFNVIYLGHGCQGMSCASRLYFGKKVQDLSLAEAALLARLPKAPVDYSPFKNPGGARIQHLHTLRTIAENGFLAEDQVETVYNNFWKDYWNKVIVRSPSQNIWADRMDLAPYFTEYVRQILESTEEIGPEDLYTRGLRIYTTLDLTQQQIAEDELYKQVKEVNKVGKYYAETGGKGGVDTSLFGLLSTLGMILPVGSPEVRGLDDRGKLRMDMEEHVLDAAQFLSLLTPAENEGSAFDEFRKATTHYTTNLEVQGAFVGIEPRSGYITSMIGGTKFSPTNQYNRALFARRQPGSAFKIFVYGAALEKRAISTATGLNDSPFSTIGSDGGSWSPGNYDEGFMGMVPASTAFALSLNTCSVQTYYKIGPNAIIDFATRMMKIPNKRRFNGDPALALGASEVTPMEMATAAAIIANEGKDVIPFPVRFVQDQTGTTIYNPESLIRKSLSIRSKNNDLQVIEPALAFTMRNLMISVANHGTATLGMRDVAGFRGDAAAKTGTTSSWSDAWIVGFNPDIALSVWFGFDKSSVTLGPGQAGGHIASPVMGRILKRYYDTIEAKPPEFTGKDEPPPGVIKSMCGGWALAPKDGGRNMATSEDACAGADSRMYDARELLMKEMGITSDDLGGGKIKFKTDN